MSLTRLLVLALLTAACGGAPTPPPPPAVPAYVAPAPLTEARYRTLRMWPEYEGEDKAGGHFETAVKYLRTPAEREPYRSTVREGLLVDVKGVPLNKGGVDDGKETTGLAIFVMDAAGNLYVGFEHERGKFHHSTFMAGEPVGMAGDIQIFDGRIKMISNQSGHYRPPPAAFEQVIDQLKAMGADLSKTEIRTLGVDLVGL